MQSLGKTLVLLGILLLVCGGALLLLSKTGLPLGRLPGDIHYRGKAFTFYFPVASCLLFSLLLSFLLYLFSRWRR